MKRYWVRKSDIEFVQKQKKNTISDKLQEPSFNCKIQKKVLDNYG